MRHDDWVSGLIADSPEVPEIIEGLEEVKGIPGTYYPKPLAWELSWLGFFTAKKLGSGRCTIQCDHCHFHTVSGRDKDNQRLAELHWFRKHTPTGKAMKEPKPYVVNYKGEPPF